MKGNRAALIGALTGPFLLILGSTSQASLSQAAGLEIAMSVPKLADPHAPKPKRKPTPTTSASKARDRVRITGKTRKQNSRIAESLPAKPSGTTQKTATTSRKPPREDRTRPEARRDLRMNVGMCKPLEMQGRVEGPNVCTPDKPPDNTKATRRTLPRQVVRPRPQDVSWEEVQSETKDVVFPGLSVKVQPTGRTLVNLDTIVYTDENKVSTSTVTLLGFPVVVQATPISYTWHFGDGSPALTTSTPGKPYPSKEITHKYMKRGGVSLTLTTNYAARFNVANTGWQYVDGTIPVTGPATPLQVREAVPVLVDPGR